jgi:LacI family transcriptional regulator
LVGFNNELFTEMLTPNIFKINQYSDETGKKSCGIFFSKRKNQLFKQNLFKITLNAELTVRDSSNKKNQ